MFIRNIWTHMKKPKNEWNIDRVWVQETKQVKWNKF